MDPELYRLDARLGALELLIRNLYARRFTEDPDPVGAAMRAARELGKLSRSIRVIGPEPVVNDALSAEAEEFLVAMFHEIVEIVRADTETRRRDAS
jgi:hypothetical protein